MRTPWLYPQQTTLYLFINIPSASSHEQYLVLPTYIATFSLEDTPCSILLLTRFEEVICLIPNWYFLPNLPPSQLLNTILKCISSPLLSSHDHQVTPLTFWMILIPKPIYFFPSHAWVSSLMTTIFCDNSSIKLYKIIYFFNCNYFSQGIKH